MHSDHILGHDHLNPALPSPVLTLSFAQTVRTGIQALCLVYFVTVRFCTSNRVLESCVPAQPVPGLHSA